MHEKVCLAFEDNIPVNEILATVSAVFSYIENAHFKVKSWNSLMPKDRHRTLELEMHAVVPDLWMQQVFSHLLPEVKLHFSRYTLPDDLAMYATVLRDSALSIGRNTRKHAAQAYGILVGAEAKALVKVPFPEGERKGVCVLESRAKLEAVREVIPDATSIILGHMSMTNTILELNKYEMIVGGTSFETYLAACMGLGVYEIYPDSLMPTWLSKWQNPNYSMMVAGNAILAEHELKTMQQGVRLLWNKIQNGKIKTPSGQQGATTADAQIAMVQ